MNVVKHRIYYLDALKAFAIISVVMGHISGYAFVGWYQMPLFMMISGYLTSYEKFSISKRLKMLIPFFIFGIAFTSIAGLPYSGFMFHQAKYGFWFLWTLSIFFIVLWLIRIVEYKVLSKYAQKYVLLTGCITIWLFFVFLHFIYNDTVIDNFLSAGCAWLNFPSFIFGLFFNRGLKQILEGYFISTIVVCFIMILPLAFFLLQTDGVIVNRILSFMIAPFICVILFLCAEKFFLEQSKRSHKYFMIVNKSIFFLGQNTLQIYVIHGFLLFIMPSIMRQYFYDNAYTIYGFILSVIASVAICFVSVLISKLIVLMRLGFVFGR